MKTTKKVGVEDVAPVPGVDHGAAGGDVVPRHQDQGLLQGVEHLVGGHERGR